MADNFFIVRDFDWEVRRSSHLDRGLNLLAKRLAGERIPLGSSIAPYAALLDLHSPPPGSGVSTNVEQRMNMYHLVSQTLAYKVEGDLVEVGCNEGQSSVLIAKVMRSFNSDKKLHVYDSFEGLSRDKTCGWRFLQAGRPGNIRRCPSLAL